MESSSAERFRRADALFDAVLDLAPSDRAAFVAHACADDAELRADVERLLRAHEKSDRFLSGAAAELASPLIADAAGDADAGPPELPPERIGPYRIEREIGRGGMGVVYLAERDDPTFRQRVALKVVRAGAPDGRAHVTRFLAERQLLVSLEHPHIARLFDGGVTTDGLPYYTMAFCDGGSLAEKLRAGGALPVAEALRITRQLAMALGAAHARGVVHRDVKPANVLFDADGSVRLSDFGIAKIVGENPTRPGTVLGTVAYLSPEQLRGREIDRRADFWALGVTLYEMLCGVRPFDAPSYAAVLHRIVEATPEPLAQRVPAVPTAVDALVTHLLQKDPASRPASADDIVRAIDEAATPARSAVTGPAHKGTPRRRFRIGIAIGALGLLAVIAGSLVWQRMTSLPAKPPSTGVMVRSVAVLPFENSVGTPADDPIIDGFTDELIGTLGKVRGLSVTARSSAFALEGSSLDPRAIADTLGVEYLIEGNVRHVGSSYVVLVELVHPRNGSAALWTETYRGEWKTVFAVQPEIARAIAGALQGRFALPDAPRAGTYSAADSLYLLGRFTLYAGMRPENMQRAEEYFREAIARDSTYARAYAGLSDIYTASANFGYGDPTVASANARANADRALQLDSTLAVARTSLGHALCTHDYDWAGSERELRRALERNPSYAYARRVLAICLRAQGRFDEALAQLDTAARADPLDLGTTTVLGRVYVNAGRSDDAIRVLTNATRAHPQADMAWEQLGHAYLLKGMHGEAIAALQSAARLTGARDSAQLAYAYAVTGDRATAKRIVQTLLASRSQRYVPPFHVAMAYAGLGQTNDAFRWLDLAFDERASFLDGVMVDPGFESLRGDPRWRVLLAKMGLDRVKQ